MNYKFHIRNMVQAPNSNNKIDRSIFKINYTVNVRASELCRYSKNIVIPPIFSRFDRYNLVNPAI